MGAVFETADVGMRNERREEGGSFVLSQSVENNVLAIVLEIKIYLAS